MTSPAPSESSKAELRRDALARRDAIAAAERAAAAERVASRPFPVTVADGACVSGFFPLRSEINPVPLMRRLADAGAKLALPVVVGRGRPRVAKSRPRLLPQCPDHSAVVGDLAREIAVLRSTCPLPSGPFSVLTEREVIDCRGT